MSELFSLEEVQHSYRKVINELGLTRKLEMSLSGTYYVTLCEDKTGQEYIVKVRQKTADSVRKSFHKEATLNTFFSEHNAPFAAPGKVLFYTDLTPEVLAYTVVEGKALGWYYFYTGENQLRRVGAPAVVAALDFLVANTDSLKTVANLETATAAEMVAAQAEQREHALAAGLTQAALDRCVRITTQYAESWLSNPVVVHGDLNPKNVLATPDAKIGFIDWSDAHCNGQYYDLAFLWLALWRVPDVQETLVSELKNNSKQFWQMVVFWTPKFYAMLHDVSTALNDEFASGKIPQEAHDDNMRYVQQALHFYNDRLEAIFTQAE